MHRPVGLQGIILRLLIPRQDSFLIVKGTHLKSPEKQKAPVRLPAEQYRSGVATPDRAPVESRLVRILQQVDRACCVVSSLVRLTEGLGFGLKARLLNLEGFRSTFINQIEFRSESFEGGWPPSSAPPPAF